MLATTHKLIPLAELHKHEAAVLRGLDSLPIFYSKRLLEEPEIRYPFLYYALLTHWPERINGECSDEEISFNRYYWFLRLSTQYQAKNGYDAGYEQQAFQMVGAEDPNVEIEFFSELEEKVKSEIANNELEIAVSFSDFSMSKALADFSLQLDETTNLFASVPPVAVSALLSQTLAENTQLALAIGTEKARSELIIAPVLVEIRRQLSNTISMFSGIELDVDAALGLRGTCDFLLCQSPHQSVVEAPIVSVVEAKKEDIPRGIGHCLAEMVAANLFNQRKKKPVSTVYGIVTTGNVWKFLRLTDAVAYLDTTEYYINDVERIVGIIVSMFTASGIVI